MRKSFGKTDTGCVRANNEDSFFVSSGPVGRLPYLCAVADGMGGHNAGEVASREALRNFVDYIGGFGGGFRYSQDLLADAARYANREVFRISREDGSLGGMGTTLSAVSWDDDNLYYAHIGDSRVYIISDGVIRAVTQDHSLVAELVRKGEITEKESREHPKRNIVTRALGTDADVEADCGYDRFDRGASVLLCSDGLTGMLDDAAILALVEEDGGAEAIVDRLVDKALELGGFDNVTVVFIDRER